MKRLVGAGAFLGSSVCVVKKQRGENFYKSQHRTAERDNLLHNRPDIIKGKSANGFSIH